MRAFSSIEILVALAVLTITVTGVVLISLSIPIIIADARSAASALESAHLSLREVESESDREVTTPGLNIAEASSALEQLEDESFWRLIRTVPWQPVRGGLRAEILSGILRDTATRSTCDPFTSGDWSHPIVTHSYRLRPDLVSLVQNSAYTISSLSLTPGMLTIGIGSTTQSNLPVLFFFSLHSTDTPHFLASFDTATTSKVGISSLAASYPYVFVGNGFGSASGATCGDGRSCAQVLVYLAASGVIVERSILSLATSSPPYAATVAGATAPTTALTYYQKLLYLGLQKTVKGNEFIIIDAHDPTHLYIRSGYAVGRSVTSITVRGTHAYVSTDDPNRELLIFDIQDPDHPVLIGSWNAPGTSTFGFGAASTVHGTDIRFGRTYTPNGPEFERLDVTDSSHIVEGANIDSGTGENPESVRALVTQDRLTFMLLTHRLDILGTHNTTQTRLIGTYRLPDGSTGAALSCRNNQLYLGRNASDGSGIIDILQGS